MIVSINQPAFVPWLGYFHRIMKSDLHIVLDHVQFEKNSFTNRNRIRTPDGSLWLTVPLKTSGKFGDLAINKVEIFNDGKWQKKITESVKQFYKKSPYFNLYFSEFEHILHQPYDLMCEPLQATNQYFLDHLHIDTPLQYSSKMQCTGAKADLVVNLCQQTGCTTYVSGPLGRNYLEEQKFEDLGIKVIYHDFNHPVYRQMHEPFIPYLSTLDLMFNEGPASGDILKSIPLHDRVIKQ